jgi:hypothetical protein
MGEWQTVVDYRIRSYLTFLWLRVEYSTLLIAERRDVSRNRLQVLTCSFWGGLLFTARYVLSALPVREKRTGLFEMIVGVVTTCHLVLQMQPHVISFYGVTSRIRFKFLLFPQVSSARILQRSAPQPLATTSSRTRTTHQMQ